MADPVMPAAFVLAALAQTLTPRSDMVTCIGHGPKRGPRAAWATRAGMSFRELVHGLVGASAGSAGQRPAAARFFRPWRCV